jgi:N-ethylmaleimide reductase
MLFTPYRLGSIELRNRVVMAPMTRSRSPGNAPGEIVATYYAQRAEAGLIVTEGTAPSPDGLGYARIPGLFDAAQARAWRRVTDAVHAAGSRMFVQLMHTGRVGHPLNLPAGARLLGPSAVALEGTMWTDAQGPQPHPVPEAMTEADIARAVGELAHAARLAVGEAGFDGVELHGANGYLIDQFLNVGANVREDRWGGSVENRARFAVEAARATAAAVGGDRVGIRLSPFGTYNGMRPDPEHAAVYEHLAGELRGLAYVHLVGHPELTPALTRRLRESFGGTLILSGGYDRERAEADLRAGLGDLVAFGRPFLANPRLVTKLRERAELAQPDYATLYTPGEKGYIDYAA